MLTSQQLLDSSYHFLCDSSTLTPARPCKGKEKILKFGEQITFFFLQSSEATVLKAACWALFRPSARFFPGSAGRLWARLRGCGLFLRGCVQILRGSGLPGGPAGGYAFFADAWRRFFFDILKNPLFQGDCDTGFGWIHFCDISEWKIISLVIHAVKNGWLNLMAAVPVGCRLHQASLNSL